VLHEVDTLGKKYSPGIQGEDERGYVEGWEKRELI
jgi:hypothetical protein